MFFNSTFDYKNTVLNFMKWSWTIHKNKVGIHWNRWWTLLKAGSAPKSALTLAAKAGREYFHHLTKKKGFSMAPPPLEALHLGGGRSGTFEVRMGTFDDVPRVGSISIDTFTGRNYLASCWFTLYHHVNVYHIVHLNLRLSIEPLEPPSRAACAADGPLGVGWSGCNATIKIIWKDPISSN